MAFGRALLATVLCTGLGVAAAPAGGDASAHHVTLNAPGCATCCAIDLCVDTPDFVVPDAVEAPSRPAAAGVIVAIAAPRDAARPGRVLDVAPKTSPPRA